MHSRSIKAATKAEKKRFERIVEAGCVACSVNGLRTNQHAEVHHLLDGGVRRGHAFTVGLCFFHHRGIPIGTRSVAEMTDAYGPSLYHNARAFHERFGSDEELLAIQNQLIEESDRARV